MLSEINEAKAFLIEKFGDADKIIPGTYAVPTQTSLGPAFMKVVVNEDLGVSDFSLWLDEDLTESWRKAVETKKRNSRKEEDMISEIGETFLQWAQSYFIEERLNIEISKPIIYTAYINYSPYAKNTSGVAFKNKLKLFCQLKGWDLNPQKKCNNPDGRIIRSFEGRAEEFFYIATKPEELILIEIKLEKKQMKKAIKECEKRKWSYSKEEGLIKFHVPKDCLSDLLYVGYYIFG